MKSNRKKYHVKPPADYERTLWQTICASRQTPYPLPLIEELDNWPANLAIECLIGHAKPLAVYMHCHHSRACLRFPNPSPAHPEYATVFIVPLAYRYPTKHKSTSRRFRAYKRVDVYRPLKGPLAGL